MAKRTKKNDEVAELKDDLEFYREGYDRLLDEKFFGSFGDALAPKHTLSIPYGWLLTGGESVFMFGVPFIVGALALSSLAVAIGAPFYFFGPLVTAYGVLACAAAAVAWKVGTVILES